MVDAVAVSDQSVGDAAQIEQAIPVGIVACHAGDLEAEHDAHVSERHFRDHTCEPGALREPGAFLRAVCVDALVRICAGGRSAMVVPTATTDPLPKKATLRSARHRFRKI